MNIEDVIAAAERHGQDSEPDHEVGDLQDCLRAAAGLFTEEQRIQFYKTEAVMNVLEWGGES